MIRNRYVLKSIAILCVLLTVNSFLFPTLSYALTSGPTAPEATSFEPVDTTDMVDLLTGDFTYNIPMLEVPGPAGGYPLSLSYHAGIQPNEDASWVGLGWTLNPGAINRSVNGYPDDYQNVSNMNRTFWEGGETKTLTVGVSVGVANAASVSAGLSFSNDTFRGRGVGGYVGAGVGFNIGGNDSPGSIGINGQIGVTPYGDPYASAGVSAGLGTTAEESLNIGASIGVQANTLSGVSAGAGAGVSYRGAENAKGRVYNASLLGASISTGGTKASLSVGGGASSVHNNRSNNVSSYSSNFGGDIPIWPGINIRIAQSYQRYWIDETVDVGTFGSLYLPNSEYQVSEVKAFDTYDLAEENSLEVEEIEPVKTLGGTFPDYDSYQVLAQGVAGSIRPYHFQKNLARQYRTTNVEVSKELKRQMLDSDILGPVGKTVINLFPRIIENEITVPSVESVPLGFADKKPTFRFINDFSNRLEYEAGNFKVDVNDRSNYLSFQYNNDIITGETGSDGYHAENNRLAGSKHVVHYTNAEILRQTNRNPFAEGFINTKAAGFVRENNAQIGGFMVTNESGVTYHFALPAYSYDEYMKSENVKAKVETFNELKKPEKYAYTWYLTAVTGPDYVDRGNQGLDESDWGYWVSFEYGQWTNNYQWRNPGIGFNQDIDGEFENFSYGIKELYYLDAIRTATHTALFIKQMRKDGKGVSNKESGGYKVYKEEEVNNGTIETENCGKVHFPTSVLGLESIYLFKNSSLTNSSLNTLRESGIDNKIIYNYDCTETINIGDNCSGVPCNEEGQVVKEHHLKAEVSHFADNVLDINDLAESDLMTKALRAIDLQTDYSLSPNTANSFDNEKLYQENYQELVDGKYTLTGITFLGKEGKQVIPSTTFSYAKNPAYNKDKYDVWGFYKSDYSSELQDQTNENISRMTSEVSAESVDAWSLSKIATPLGANIQITYESDRYEQVVAGQHTLRIKDVIADQGQNKLKITFWDEANSLNHFYQQGDQTDIDLFGAYKLTQSVKTCDISGYTRRSYTGEPMEVTESNCTSDINYREKAFIHAAYHTKQAKVTNVTADYIVVEDENLYKQFTQNKVDDPDLRKRFYFNTNKPDYVVGGIARIAERKYSGGGIRVQSLSIESQGKTYTTQYEYQGGTTTYEPFKILAPVINPAYSAYEPEFHKLILESFNNLFKRYSNIYGDKEKNLLAIKNEYKGVILNTYKDLLSVARELPGPGVMYEYVTVKEQREDASGNIYLLPNYSTYQFEMYKDDMVSITYEATQNELAEGTNPDNPDSRPPGSRGTDPTKERISADGTQPFSVRSIVTRKVSLQDMSTRVGNLKKITLYDQNGAKISETINHFLADDENYESLLEKRFANQGKVVETFADARKVFIEKSRNARLDNGAFNLYNLFGVITQRKTYPVVQTGQTTVNYKTGITTTSRNLTFDYFSGDVISTLSQDSYGNYYLSKAEPAYWFYDGMGLKTDNPNNKNMLSQQASSTVYKVEKLTEGPVYSENDLAIKGLVSSMAQTWSNKVDALDKQGNIIGQDDIWRKEASYHWNGSAALQHDGTYPMSGNGAFSAFDFRNMSKNTAWEQTGAITLYDVNSHALEVQDINGNYAATRMDPALYKVIASAANASYSEFAYSGAEHLRGRSEEGGVNISPIPGEVGISNAFAHTGAYSLIVNTGQQGFSAKFVDDAFTSLNKPYFASVWVYLPGKSETVAEMAKVRLSAYGDDGKRIASVAPVYQQQKSKSWYLLNLLVKPQKSQSIRIVCENGAERGVYFDDFRVHPLDASMTSFVYDQQTDELTYILDTDNLYTHFEYDSQGRLIRSSRERLNFDFGDGKRSFRADQKLQQTNYNYAKSPK